MPTPLDRAQDEQVSRVRHCHRRRHAPPGQDEPIGTCAASLDLGLDVAALEPCAEDARDGVERLIARRLATDHPHVAKQFVV